MPRKKNDNLFSSIEIGTHSIKVLIAEAKQQNVLHLIGNAETESLKVVKGEIDNIQMVDEQLEQAIDKAQETAGTDIRDTFVAVAVSGSHISQDTISETVKVASFDQIISQEDINQVIRNARQHDVAKKHSVLSTSVRYYSLDDGRQFLDPIGQASPNLQAAIQIIKAQKHRLTPSVNLVQNRLGRDINTLCYTPLAIACACLTPQDLLQNGHLLIDVGAGVTSFTLITAAGCHTAGQITVGFEQAANDLAIAFRLHIQFARQLLRNFSQLQLSVIPAENGSSRAISADQGPGIKPKLLPATSVERIVNARFTELFQIINERLTAENAWQWATGDILISGGASQLPGLIELAQTVFRRPVQPARPIGITGPVTLLDNPAYITAIGTLRSAKQSLDIYREQNRSADSSSLPSGFKGILDTIKLVFNI